MYDVLYSSEYREGPVSNFFRGGGYNGLTNHSNAESAPNKIKINATESSRIPQ